MIGAGSVGRRHAENLASLGCRLVMVDPRPDRRDAVEKESWCAGTHGDLSAALSSHAVQGGVIASPTAFHAAQVVELSRAGVAILLEKPAAMDLASGQDAARAAEAAGVPILLGYTWRWWPPLLRIRELLQDGAVGQPISVAFEMAAHLADWHPFERYQDFFMASQALGGGALLDESHWIDALIWLFGMPSRVAARVERVSDLEIDTDDNVDILAWYDNGIRATVHLDLYARPHRRSCRIVGHDGTLEWTSGPDRIGYGASSQTWVEERFDIERNEMFVSVAREFMSVLGGDPPRTCTVKDGLRALEIIEAARRSSLEGRVITLGSTS